MTLNTELIHAALVKIRTRLTYADSRNPVFADDQDNVLARLELTNLLYYMEHASQDKEKYDG